MQGTRRDPKAAYLSQALSICQNVAKVVRLSSEKINTNTFAKVIEIQSLSRHV
jgi:hypothetical protein